MGPGAKHSFISYSYSKNVYLFLTSYCLLQLIYFHLFFYVFIKYFLYRESNNNKWEFVPLSLWNRIWLIPFCASSDLSVSRDRTLSSWRERELGKRAFLCRAEVSYRYRYKQTLGFLFLFPLCSSTQSSRFHLSSLFSKMYTPCYLLIVSGKLFQWYQPNMCLW